MKYLLGLVLIGVGFVIMWKSDWIMNNFGRIPWAEKHLGMEGGTRLFWKLIGLLIILGSFLYMSGGLGTIMGAIFSNSINQVGS